MFAGEQGGIPTGSSNILDQLFGAGTMSDQEGLAGVLSTVGNVGLGVLKRIAAAQASQPGAGTPAQAASGAPAPAAAGGVNANPGAAQVNPIDYQTTAPDAFAAVDRQKRQWGTYGKLIGQAATIAAAAA